MRTKTRRLLLLTTLFALLALAFASHVYLDRGFRLTLENRSSRTLENLRFVLEDQGTTIEVPRLAPGETARVRFSKRNPEGSDLLIEFDLKGRPGRDEARPVGMVFATLGKSADLRLTDVPLKDGRTGVRIDGYWTEAFDGRRWFLDLRGGGWPGRRPWPTTILDEEP